MATSPSDDQYWCHHCEKRVTVEPSEPNQPVPELICSDCKFGFVESIPAPNPDTDTDNNLPFDHPTLASQFLHVLRLLSHVSPSPSPSPDARYDDDDNDNDNDDDDDDNDSVRSVEIEGLDDDDIVDVDVDVVDGDEDEVDEENVRRIERRDVLRIRLREFATRARSGGRVLDWAEILMGLEADRYVGNPGDYVNEAEYEALLANLAEAEGGKRGAPPAAKMAVEGLKEVVVKDDGECLICKEGVSVGDVVKEMPCGHGYHGECIVTWLGTRNSCPVCRFELVTDDAEYEEEKKKTSFGSSAGADADGGGGSSSVENLEES